MWEVPDYITYKNQMNYYIHSELGGYPKSFKRFLERLEEVMDLHSALEDLDHCESLLDPQLKGEFRYFRDELENLRDSYI